MSAIGPGNMGGYHIAGSAAGAQKNDAQVDKIRAVGGDTNSQIARQKTNGAAADVSAADETDDRDADGRQAWHQDADEENAGEQSTDRNQPTDASANEDERDCGRFLDFDA